MLNSRFLHTLFCALILAGLAAGCSSPQPIRVGFAGELTGKQADLGTHGRDGALLAVETLNAAGGIGGRPIELLVRDDLGTPEGAQAADRELIKQGVVAIIGHMTSGQTIAGLQVTQPARLVLLSPAASTPDLNGRQDLFFRVTPTNLLQASAFAKYIFQQRKLERLAIIYDGDNAAYAQAYADAFEENYGGQIVARLNFSAAAEPDFAPLVLELRAANPAGVLIIASALNTALIAQQIRLHAWDAPLFSSAWAQTEALIQNGGRAVEGLEIVIAYDTNSQHPAYLDFKQRYEARFGRAPTFAAAEAYEAALVLAAALEKTQGRAQGLPQALLATRDFPALIGTLSLDPYGDVIRPVFLLTIRNGKYETKMSLEP